MPVCGDSNVDPGETCDDGNQDDLDECTNMCLPAVCGDGFIQTGVDECDDGNQVDEDDCTNACTLAACGDGIVAPNEMCDDGNDIEDDGCNSQCMAGSCGDGVVQMGEACDDGDNDNTDACAGCQTATCGDGFVQAGVEDCDDQNMVNTDTCAGCKAAKCGDGFIQAGTEDCDDGNTNAGDGCSATCKSEVDAQCNQPYNTFTQPTRINSFNDNGQTVYCDLAGNGLQTPDWKGPGWYRYMGAAGTQMADAPPGDYHCGTHAAGWLNDPHPTPQEGVVQRTVCFDWTPGDCWQTWEIGVVNCGNFYLYNLIDTIACSYVYCGRN